MQLSEYRRRTLTISILLMMVFVQLFSLHAHFPDDHDHDHSHVHSHILDVSHDDHLHSDHDEDTATTFGTLIKHTYLLDYCVFVFLIVIPVALYRLNIRNAVHNNRRSRHLQFFQPLLRAPPA